MQHNSRCLWTLPFFNSRRNEPNNGQGGSDCAELETEGIASSFWRDRPCDIELAFICEGTGSSYAMTSDDDDDTGKFDAASSVSVQ